MNAGSLDIAHNHATAASVSAAEIRTVSIASSNPSTSRSVIAPPSR